MTKFNTKSLLIIVVILLIGITALWQIQRRASPAAAWFSDAWQYRKAINIGYTGATALTDFQVSVDIGTSALIAAGKMKSDCSDIRFTDQNGNLLNYWIEENNPGCNQITDTKIWIKVPSVKTSGTNIYIYYGNSSATSFQDGNKVFLMFDNFTSNISWSSYEGTTNISGGTLVFTPTGSGNWKHYTVTDQDNISGQTSYIVEHRYKTAAKAGGTLIRYVDNNNFWGLETGYNNLIQIRGYAGGVEKFLTSGAHTYSINTYVIFKTIYDGSTHNVKVFADGSQIINYNVTGGDQLASTTSVGVIDHLGYGPSTSDWIFVRKYAASDPTKTLLDEERSPAPIAYWSFDEGVGTSVFDSSSNRNNGLITGATWQTEESCLSGKCLNFSGTNSFINVQSNNINTTNDFTVSVWVKSLSDGNSVTGIINKEYSNGANDSKGFALNWNSGPYFKVADGTANYKIVSYSLSKNNWYYLTGVRSGSKIYLYVNGILRGEDDITGYTDYNHSLNIGKYAVFNGHFFTGYIDEPKIYAYARTAAQIKQDYRAGLAGMKAAKGVNVAAGSKSAKSLSDGLVGYWKMDENTGTIVGDSSGVGNTGVFGTGDSAPFWSNGKYGVGVSFDGVNDYINFGNPNLSSLTNATISFWRKGPNTPANWLLFQGQSSLYYIMATSGGTGNFYHSNAGGNKTIYVDGKVVLAPPSDNNWHHYVISGVNLSSWTTFLLNNYSNWHFKGAIDEIRLYNRALSYDEVRQLAEYAPGPVAYYDFEEGVGTTLYDRSGNGNNGVWQGTLGNHYSAGKVGQAGQFNGSDNYVNINSSSSLNIEGPITLETWVKPSIGSGQQGIIGTYGHSGAYSLYLRHATDVDIAFWNNINGITNYKMGGNVNYGKWNHFASIWDGDNINLYHDGLLIYSGVGTSASNTRNFQGLYLGYINSIASPRYLNGLIDEVKIYNYARTQKQILQDMNASAPVGGMSKIGKPIAWYKFDEGQGTTANNSGSIGSTSNGTFGTGNSAPTWTNNGKFGKALSLDGSDYVFLPGSNLENIGAVGDFTITAWNNQSSFSGVKVIVGQGFAGAPGGHTYGRWQIGTNESKGHISLYGGSSSPSYKRLTGLINLQTDTWNHITAIYSRSEGKLKLYINGKYDSQLTWDGYIENVFANRMAIGYNSGTNAQYMNGLIDEVKIYNYALSEDEIKQDYNQGSTAVIGKSTQTIGATTTSLDYCIPGDASTCSAPIAEYNFEEGVGTTAYDKSGNNNHCYISNNPSWTSGKVGGALQFNGSNQRCTKTGGITIGQITAEAWVYRTSSTTNQGIIRQQNSFILSLKDDTIQLGGTSFINTGITIPLNSWQHVAWTNDGHNHILFINGQEKWTTSGGTLPNNTNDLNVAYDNNNWWWGGKIDSVKVYNYARTPAQIAYDYNKGAPIGHWKMNECQGSTIHDSSGNNNHGTLTIGAGGSQSSIGTCQTSGAWYDGKIGKINSAMSFDGTDDYITISSLGSTLVNSSISAWVKNTGSTGTWQVLVSLGGASGIMNIACEASDNQQCGCDLSNGISNPVNIGSNTWTHITCTKTPDGMIQYINGKYSSFESNSSVINLPTLNIGKRYSDIYFSKSLIDDVRIYNYALTSEQVRQIYNGGAMNFR